MKKNTKDLIKALSLIPAVILAPLILFILLLAVLYGAAFVVREVQHYQIRSEIFAYVEERKESIEISNPQYSQHFEYTDWGFVDAGVIYGYVYSPDDRYITNSNKYRNGYRFEGSTTYGDGWFYYEKICDNWYYYEEHYG